MLMLKETEIGSIPIDWNVSELGDICTLLTDGSHFSPKEEPSQYYMASVKDMRYNYFDFNNCKTISKSEFDKLVQGNCSPNKGDILISKDGANCLDLIFVYNQPEKIVLLSSIAIARLKKGFDSNYYRYYLLSPRAQYVMRNNFVSGSAIPRVVLKDFRKVLVPLIPYNEQIIITSILSSLDNKINLLNRQNKTLEELAETLFRQWFIEESDIKKTVILNDYVECINGISYKSSELNPSKTALVTLKSFNRNGGFSIDGFKEFTGKFKDSQKVVEGDLVVAHTDITQEAEIIGNPALIITNPDFDSMVISMDLVKVNSIVDWVSKEFLYFLMRSREFKYHCLGCANGSTVLHLNKQAIPTFEFPLFEKEKVIAFTKQATAITQKIFKNHKQLRNLIHLRDALLPKLMSGEVRVKM